MKAIDALRMRGPGFSISSPADIAGLSFWYDAQDGSTVFQNDALTTPGANGQPVGGWTDKSGNGRLISNIGTARPTYRSAGSPRFVEFDGSNDSLVCPSTNIPCGTAFMVVRPYSAASGTDNDAGLLTNRTDQASDVDVAFSRAGAVDTFYVSQGAGAALADSSHHWYNQTTQTANYNTAAVGVYSVDGTGFPANLRFPTGISVGIDRQIAFRAFRADVYEIIGYGSVLTTAQRNAVENYLAAKYGITF